MVFRYDYKNKNCHLYKEGSRLKPQLKQKVVG